MKHRLEINNSGSWKTLCRFDSENEPLLDALLTNAAHLIDIMSVIEGRQTATLRVCTDEKSPRVIEYYRNREWEPCA